MSTRSSYTVKLLYVPTGELRRRAGPVESLSDLRLDTSFGVGPDVCLSFTDDEGEEVIVQLDDELRDAIECVVEKMGLSTVRCNAYPTKCAALAHIGSSPWASHVNSPVGASDASPRELHTTEATAVDEQQAAEEGAEPTVELTVTEEQTRTCEPTVAELKVAADEQTKREMLAAAMGLGIRGFVETRVGGVVVEEEPNGRAVAPPLPSRSLLKLLGKERADSVFCCTSGGVSGWVSTTDDANKMVKRLVKVHRCAEIDARWRLQEERDRPPARAPPAGAKPTIRRANHGPTGPEPGVSGAPEAADGGRGCGGSGDWESESDSEDDYSGYNTEADDHEGTVRSPHHNGRRYVVASMQDVPGTLSTINADVDRALHDGLLRAMGSSSKVEVTEL